MNSFVSTCHIQHFIGTSGHFAQMWLHQECTISGGMQKQWPIYGECDIVKLDAQKIYERYMMRKILQSLFFIHLLFCGFGVACSRIVDSVNTTPTVTGSSVATIVTTSEETKESIEEEYIGAIERWGGHRITSYEITVDVFSSVLSPACHMQATLTVRDNALIGVREIVTPEVNQLPDGKLIQNPQCSEYERYLIKNLFDFVNTLLHNKQGVDIRRLEFDPEYGYISYLYIIGGESVLDVTTTNFAPK